MIVMASPLLQVPHMNGGDGETSYANTSSTPRKVMMMVKPILEESINKIYGTSLPTCFKVADLGCSCGPNTLLLASIIIDIMHETSLRLKAEPATLQYFLNDLFGNDFNSIFKSLPEFYGSLKQDATCLINATPGTFYGNLFPPNSIHMFHSCFSLHWLSQVPTLLKDVAKLGDDDKGNVSVASICPPSFAKQFKKDFTVFLISRSKELVLGGGMLLTFIGRYDPSENINPPELIHMILNDMVSENLIQQADLKHFHIPNYFATADEVEEIIKEEGSFSIERLEYIKIAWDGSNIDEEGCERFKDENESGEFLAKFMRSVLEPLLKGHFGEGIIDELFLRFPNKVVELMPKLVFPTLVISLTKVA